MIIKSIEEKDGFFIIDGLFIENVSAYSVRFIGNEQQNILTCKKIEVSYDNFSPSSVQLVDSDLSNTILEDLKAECMDIVLYELQEEECEEEENEIFTETLLYQKVSDSSFIEAIFYNLEENLLGVKFYKNRTLYVYKHPNISSKCYGEFVETENKSGFLRFIKENYKMQKLEKLSEIKKFFGTNTEQFIRFFSYK